jgi:phosphoglucosamine mutase
MLADDHHLGGEQSGHIIMRKFANTGDGILTALQLMQAMVASRQSLADLSTVMKRYPQVLINVKNVNKSALETSETIKAHILSMEEELAETGRILVRASGTESLVRVMVEAESEAQAEQIAHKLAEIVRSELEITK